MAEDFCRALDFAEGGFNSLFRIIILFCQEPQVTDWWNEELASLSVDIRWFLSMLENFAQ